jgi:hypothetical protein
VQPQRLIDNCIQERYFGEGYRVYLLSQSKEVIYFVSEPGKLRGLDCELEEKRCECSRRGITTFISNSLDLKAWRLACRQRR